MMDKQQLFQKLVALARQRGATSSHNTLAGLKAFLKKNPACSVFTLAKFGQARSLVEPRFRLVPLTDPAKKSKADETARRKNPRKRNWRSAAAVADPVRTGDIVSIDLGRYSRGCPYTHWEYQPVYYSAVKVWRSGRNAHYLTEGVEKHLPAPAGTRWTYDVLGPCLVRDTDGMDYHPTVEDCPANGDELFAGWHYHPTVEDCLSRNFATRVRRGMASKFNAVRKAAKDARKAKEAKEREERALRCNTRIVSLRLVSKAAGNCSAGTEQWLENLGIATRERARAGAVYRLASRKGLVTPDFLRAARVALN